MHIFRQPGQYWFIYFNALCTCICIDRKLIAGKCGGVLHQNMRHSAMYYAMFALIEFFKGKNIYQTKIST